MRDNSYKKLSGSLMIQGTTSDAGKSIMVAGLCRVLKRRGISVAPFKPQNMALNSAVTACGGEIGRAQALQAAACGLDLETDFNPVLLKPSSDKRSQVIIHGKAVSELDARTFGDIKSLAFDKVLESYWRLRKQYQVVLIEGAGSPAEINLRENDIANMGFAEAVDCPVALISDINRGGVFAHLTGTLNLLSASEQKRTKGFIINQFRGHLSLLQGGLDWLENYTSKPVLGVLPFIQALKLDAEDALTSDGEVSADSQPLLKVKVAVFPRTSNHTDFDPLRWHPQVEFEYVTAGQSLKGADLIILPGSKCVRGDLAFLKAQGWDKQITSHLRYGGKLLGVCGGFQMLGNSIADPLGIESEAGTSDALGLLDFTTLLQADKRLTQIKGACLLSNESAKNSIAISGYEIHCGVSKGSALNRPFAQMKEQNKKEFNDGAISEDGQIAGTYIHGLLEEKTALAAILKWADAGLNDELETLDWQQVREQELERLADVFEEHLDIDKIIALIE